MCSIIGTPNNHHFPFGTNGKVVVLGVPILKHFRVVNRAIMVVIDLFFFFFLQNLLGSKHITKNQSRNGAM